MRFLSMRNRIAPGRRWGLAILAGSVSIVGLAWAAQERASQPPRDAVAEAQTPRNVPVERVEQKRTEHDRSGLFAADKAPNSSTAFEGQPEKGRINGFDFYRDPLNASQPMESPESITK